jgi:hypothetical protein
MTASRPDRLFSFPFLLNIWTEEVAAAVFARFVGAYIARTFVHVVASAVWLMLCEEYRCFENYGAIV